MSAAINTDLQLPPHSNDAEEELRRVRLALDTVYSATTTTTGAVVASGTRNDDDAWFQQRAAADRYLTSFQNTAIAWVVCDRLLQQESASPSSTRQQQQQQQRRFFAAQTLHKKCRTDVHELPTESLSSLRDSLLNHFQGSVAGNNVALTTRLAMAIAALSIQMGWMTVVSDLMNVYRHGGKEKQRLLLFFLRSLPEECASDRLYLVEENHRYSMRDQLIANSIPVFEFLQESLPQDPSRVWEVLHIWIRYVPVRPQVIAETSLLPLTVQTLQQADSVFLEAAADVIVEVLRMYPSHQPGNEELVRRMIPLLSQLPLERALQSNDEDIQRAYCRVVTEMGESYLSWILSPDFEQARQLVNWVLQCAGRIEDTEIASITLHFWYRFVIDMELVEPDQWRQELIDAYEGQLLDLISVCAQHLMKYPDEMMSTDRLDDWHKHRYYVSETIEDCCRLLGGQAVVKRMTELLRAAVQNRPNSKWQNIESCLECLCALHRFIPNDEATVLPSVFTLLPQLPAYIPPLRATASRTVGKYAPWLASHSDYLPPLLPFLAQGLTIPQCSSSVAVAIKELCAYSNPMTNFDIAEPVLQLYQEVSQRGQMMIEDELQILEGVCRALSRKAQDSARMGNTATAFLETLVNPMGQRLTSNIMEAAGSSHRAAADIDRLAVVVQYLKMPIRADGSHPIVAMLQSLWTVLEQTSKKFANDTQVAEKICRLYKHSLRSCSKDAYRPLLQPLMHQLVQSYEQTHQSPYLYAASICLTEYGRGAILAQPLYDMVARMAETTFGFMRDLQDFSSQPDVMEEFFYLMERMVSYCPEPLIRSSLLPPLLQCAAMTMQVDHPGVNKGTLKFLESIFAYDIHLREQSGADTSRHGLEHILLTEGRPIVVNLTRALMTEFPSYGPSVPDILWYATRFCPVQGWITEFFETTSNSAHAWPSARARNELLGILSTDLSQDEFRLSLRSFEAVCARERRFRRP